MRTYGRKYDNPGIEGGCRTGLDETTKKPSPALNRERAFGIGSDTMVKDNAKIGISGNLSEILISFWVAVFFHDNRMRKSPGLALPLVLLWDKLCRIGPIDSRLAFF